MRRHYVTFLSPGMVMSEASTRPVDSWDVTAATKQSGEIVEHCGAKPYGFYFETRLEHDDVPDGEGGWLKVMSKELKRSGNYFINGKVLTVADLAARGEVDSTLMRNMRWNKLPFVVETNNGLRHTAQFDPCDAVVDASGAIIERGDSPERMDVRRILDDPHEEDPSDANARAREAAEDKS